MLSSSSSRPPLSLPARTASASWDTGPRLPYNPNAPRNPNKKVAVPVPAQDSSKLSVSIAERPPPSGTSSPINVSDLLKRGSNKFPIPG
ncbi:hypothetical protein MLD38_004832 [Melastoma candidum]|uniref:Uncharacterized protein n=1 Tax=Melastoma candidum TaxID=119954 RepID=A0ACB9SAX1_9MYRT|nr:hypothetical protein MLD38_004832 [Melastoma candidum]